MAIKHFGILLLVCTGSVLCERNSTTDDEISELKERLKAHDENWNKTSKELKSFMESISGSLKGIIGQSGSESSDDGLHFLVKLAQRLTGSSGVAETDEVPGTARTAGRDGSSAERGGVVYTRWGRTACGSNSTLLYSGFTGNGKWGDTGGGVNYQCMPDTPEYNSDGSVGSGAYMVGVEFKSESFGVFPDDARDKDAPCAVCYTSNRPAMLMIPAKRTCPDEWTKEYEGYLMSAQYGHRHPATFECIDKQPEYIDGSSGSLGGGRFYFTRYQCSYGSYCPPYHGSKAITCVVCTK